MKILVNEKLSEHKFKTPEGYLICVDSILARTGKQTYQRDEVFHDGDTSEIEVDRTFDEVFSPKTLASFENKPITVEHPDEDVNSENYKDYAVGYVRDVKQGNVNGENVILGTLVITDAQTIEEIENGEHTDLSCGYDCDIVDEENPQQRNIRGNHVALCQQGRAGIARIVDSVKDEELIEDDPPIYAHYLTKIKKGQDNSEILEQARKDYLMEKMSKNDYERLKKYAGQTDSDRAYDSKEVVNDFKLRLKKMETKEDKTSLLGDVITAYEEKKLTRNEYYNLVTAINAIHSLDSIHDKKYVVISEIDEEEMDRFDSLAEAKKAIKEYKRFDKEQGNPFDESYRIEIEDSIDDAKVTNKEELEFIKSAPKIYKRNNRQHMFVVKEFSTENATGYVSGDGGKTWETAKTRVVKRSNSEDTRHQNERRFGSTTHNPEIPFSHIVWCHLKGNEVIPNETIDHKNGNHMDDRIENLEPVSNAENTRRMKEKAMKSKDNINDKLIPTPQNIINEFKRQLMGIGLKTDREGKTLFGRHHLQVISIKGNNDKNDLHILSKELHNLIDKFENRYNTPVTFSMGLQEDGYISAGIDLDKTQIDDSIEDEDYYNGEEIIKDSINDKYFIYNINNLHYARFGTKIRIYNHMKYICSYTRFYSSWKMSKEYYSNWPNLKEKMTTEELIAWLKNPSINVELVDSVNDSPSYSFEVVYIDRQSDKTERTYVDAKDKNEAIQKVKKMFKPYRIIECNVWNTVDDSVDNFNELKNQIKGCKTRSQIREVLANIEAHHDEGLLTETEYNDLVNLIDGIKDSCQKDSYKKIHKAVNIIKGINNSKVKDAVSFGTIFLDVGSPEEITLTRIVSELKSHIKRFNDTVIEIGDGVPDKSSKSLDLYVKVLQYGKIDHGTISIKAQLNGKAMLRLNGEEQRKIAESKIAQKLYSYARKTLYKNSSLKVDSKKVKR